MASLLDRNGYIHISYYKNKQHFRYSLKIRATKEGWEQAKKIKKHIESTIIYDRLKLKVFGEEKHNQVLRLSEAVKLYMQNKGLNESNKGGFHSSTKSLIEAIGDIDIHSVRTEHYNLLYSYLQNKIGYNTIVSYTKHLRAMFNFFIKEKYISENPFPYKKMQLKKVRTIPDEHLLSILDRLYKEDNEIYFIVRLLILTGQRISEALNTKRSDVNFIDKLFIIHNNLFRLKFVGRFYLYFMYFKEKGC